MEEAETEQYGQKGLDQGRQDVTLIGDDKGFTEGNKLVPEFSAGQRERWHRLLLAQCTSPCSTVLCRCMDCNVHKQQAHSLQSELWKV